MSMYPIPPPGLFSKGVSFDESTGKGEGEHVSSCGGACCKGGFVKATTRRKRRQWRKFEDIGDIEVCTVDKVEKREAKVMSVAFQVADVKKPLIAAKRITEKGNHVMFGPQEGDNYILNEETEDKLMLKPRGRGSYVMEVRFLGGRRRP